MPGNLTVLISIISLVWLVGLTYLYLKLQSHYNSFTKGTGKNDLLNALNELIKTTKGNKKAIEDTNARLDQELLKARKHFKRFAFKRFNPFTDTGGDQSFILVLLDENNDGFVISSLHSRENTRIYGKRLHDAKAPDQVLSKEEQQVINEALKS